MSYINSRTVHDLRQGGTRFLAAILADVVMAKMTALQVESGTGGVLLYGRRDTLISGVSIDTRTIHPGDLFFAIRGERDDGHQYVRQALAKGALGAVVDDAYQIPHDYPEDKILLRAKDTHKALKVLASIVRRHWKGSLVAITGSMGKTTTKEFATQVLQTEYSVYRSPGNYNNLFGLPLAIFGLSSDDHIGVFEMGMSAPGEIAEMCRIASPSIGVITNVAPVHLAFFNSIEEIARAKAELADALPRAGTLIYNLDDLRVRNIGERFAGHRISFGMSAEAEVRALDIEVVGLHETRFKLSCGDTVYKATIPLAGSHFVVNALPAVALGIHFHMELDQIIESLRFLQQAASRGQVLNFREGFTVIDDSYNSNPRALVSMLEMFSSLKGYQRRILVAGEMLELGSSTETLHYDCGRFAAQCGTDVVVAVQGAARELARGAIDAGLPDSSVHFFTEVNPAIDFVTRSVRAGDLLLIKGSRGVHLEKVVQVLRTDHGEHVH
ncbi:MAG TPA: UDP-N-acetylmuramoyl-tripeptide--D-alanyl-D-alanine ligase [Acidobacteriota bacterium]|nr:UDP-N-acetylmuramoyl-tripeptide--D-alanyl-D-alanine ligase [Acidobacteriota bacterium]